MSDLKNMKSGPGLASTLTHQLYPFDYLPETAENGESLEVVLPDIHRAQHRPGLYLWERFADFLPFKVMDAACSLGEGNTPLLPANEALHSFTGLRQLWLKNETLNPTWSFKDRGSLACMWMVREMKEQVTATISTGNMGHSIAAYGAAAGIRPLIFVPHYTPSEKILSMSMHGAKVIRIATQDYSHMKNTLLEYAKQWGLRIVSGNGPVRTEGYKLTAFEMYEQMAGEVPDYIAVPTSACGHIRGIFKGYLEMQTAGLIQKLPKMIVVQAANNSPIVSAIKQGLKEVVPFSNFHTVAEAITSGNPFGGDEIIDKAYRYGWLAETVTESEILDGQKQLARAGYLVEPASAASLWAVKKLREKKILEPHAGVVLMLTGSGLKDMDVLKMNADDAGVVDLEAVPGLVLRMIASGE